MPLNEFDVLRLQSDIARAMITAMAMEAENQVRISEGHSPAYSETAFLNLITENGLEHNQVITRLQGAMY